MRIAQTLAVTVACSFAPLTATAQQIAITLDDLPYVMPSRTTPQQGLAQVTSVNAALAAHGVTATGFAVGAQLNRKSTPALQAFADASHTIGNHSWSHPDYDTLTIDEFRSETQWTDAILAPWLGAQRYYRFPFLREGKTEAAKSAASDVLAELGYTNVPVTIDNDEWQFNAAYLDALDSGDLAGADRIAADYIAHMQERTSHFDELGRQQMGYGIPHILLLHMNQINADHLGRLLDWYAAEGWTFITVEEALSDPFYQEPDIYAGPRGLSQIERVMGFKSE